eukprot:gene7276-11594_t
MKELRKSKSSKELKEKELEKEKLKFNSMNSLEQLQTVKIKLKNATKKLALDDKQLNNLASKLSEKEKIKKFYLNSNFKSALEYFEVDTPKSTGVISSSSGTPKSLVFDNFNEEMVEKITLEEYPDHQSVKNMKEKIKIKLVLTENARTTTQKTIRKLISPFVNAFDIGDTQLGLIHSALAIGPWYLEWDNSSLCVPKKCFSKSAMMVMDINNGYESSDVDKIVDICAEVIARWNSTHFYDNVSGNCQSFLDDLLMNLGIKLTDDLSCSKYVENYIQKLRKKGECAMEYEIPIEFQSNFEVSKVEFQTHEQLDKFVQKIFELERDINQISDQYGLDLLKGFDRAFWLRHYKEPTNENFIPFHDKNSESPNCPFEDPKSTKSFGKGEWFEDVEVSIEIDDKTDEVKIYKNVEANSKEKNDKLQVWIHKQKNEKSKNQFRN